MHKIWKYVTWTNPLSSDCNENIVFNSAISRQSVAKLLLFFPFSPHSLSTRIIYVRYTHTRIYIHTKTNTSSLPLWRNSPKRVRDASFLTFLNHTQWYTSINRTPLDEWSALCRDLYLTTHNTQKRETSIPLAGFKLAIPASDRQYKIQSPTSQKSPLNSTRSNFLCIHLLHAMFLPLYL
jgi:hypothetical protein